MVNVVATPLMVTHVWPDGRREVATAELTGAQIASYAFHDEQQGFSQTYHPENYLLQFQPRHPTEAEEVD